MRKEIIGNATLYLGDCLGVLKAMPDNSVDSIAAVEVTQMELI